MFETLNTHSMSLVSDENINIMNIKIDKKKIKIGSFDYAVAINFWCMKILGIWPLENTLFSNLQFGLIIISVCLFTMPIIMELLMLKKWSAIMCQAILTIPWIPVIGIFVFMKRMRKNFCIILRTMIADWADYRYLPKQNQQIMVNYARKGRTFNIFSLTLMGLSLAGYILTPIVIMWSSDVPYWNAMTRNLPVKGFFPFSFKESPIFEILYIMQSVIGFFGCTAIVTIDCFIYIIVFHACGQFDILAATLERYDSYARHDYMKDMRSRTCVCLSCIVKRHVHILNYMNIVERSFSNFQFILLLGYCLTLVLGGRQLITEIRDNFYDAILILFYVTTIMFIIFSYCYLSECIIQKSENIGRIAQNLEWYRLPRDSNLAIIVARSRIPCKITAGKFITMSFSYYTTILMSTISYITVLAAFK